MPKDQENEQEPTSPDDPVTSERESFLDLVGKTVEAKVNEVLDQRLAVLIDEGDEEEASEEPAPKAPERKPTLAERLGFQ